MGSPILLKIDEDCSMTISKPNVDCYNVPKHIKREVNRIDNKALDLEQRAEKLRQAAKDLLDQELRKARIQRERA